MIYILILLLTIILTSRVDLMYENLTGVLILPQYRYFAIIHIILCACFFAYKTLLIYKTLPIQKNIYKYIIILTGITMIIGSLFPYTINSRDLFSILHVYCSMLSCLSFLILLWIYTRLLSLYQPHIYHKIHWFYDLSLQFLAIFTIVFTRVNGYIEILFTLLVCSYLYMIEKELKKQP